MAPSNERNHSPYFKRNGRGPARSTARPKNDPLSCDPPANGLFTRPEWVSLLKDLSPSYRQAQILRNILSGLSDKQISQEMGVSIPTIRTHLNLIGAKLDVSGRQAVIIETFLRFRAMTRKRKGTKT